MHDFWSGNLQIPLKRTKPFVSAGHCSQGSWLKYLRVSMFELDFYVSFVCSVLKYKQAQMVFNSLGHQLILSQPKDLL